MTEVFNLVHGLNDKTPSLYCKIVCMVKDQDVIVDRVLFVSVCE